MSARLAGGDDRRRLHGGVGTARYERQASCARDCPDVAGSPQRRQVLQDQTSPRWQAQTEDRSAHRWVMEYVVALRGFLPLANRLPWWQLGYTGGLYFETCESARERRIALYKRDQQQQQLPEQSSHWRQLDCKVCAHHGLEMAGASRSANRGFVIRHRTRV